MEITLSGELLRIIISNGMVLFFLGIGLFMISGSFYGYAGNNKWRYSLEYFSVLDFVGGILISCVSIFFFLLFNGVVVIKIV